MERYIVKVDAPAGIPIGDVREYCRDALASYGGAFHPDDPFFNGVELKSVMKQEAK